MKVSEKNYFISSSTNPLDKIFFKRLFRGEKKREKIILFFHDARLHTDVFNKFFHDILHKTKNLEIYSFDIYGHGRSGGERMGPVSSESLIEDVDQVIKSILEIEELPIYLVGVGFGASLILNYLSDYEKSEIKGIVLLNPMLEVDLKLSKIEKLLYADFTYGSSLRVDSKIDVTDLIYKPDKKIDLKQDPLCFEYYTRGFLKTMRTMSKVARTRAYFVDQPSYIIYTKSSPLYKNDIIPIFSKGLRSKQVRVEEVSGSHLFILENSSTTNSLMEWIHEN
jgi:alpha-beta hydrolase superfamily lysophospholipase